MSNPSTIWATLSLPNPASGSIPFVDTDNASIITDVTHFKYIATAQQLYAAGGYMALTGNMTPAAGVIGEYQSYAMTAGSFALTTNIVVAAGSGLSLTPGEWDVQAVIDIRMMTAASNLTEVEVSLGTNSAAITGGIGSYATVGFGSAGIFGGTGGQQVNAVVTPEIRVSLAATSIIYPLVVALFTGGAVNVNSSFIRARRAS